MFDLYLRVFVNVTFQYLIELKRMLLKRIFFIFSKIRTLYIWKNKNELIITSVLKKRLWRNRYLVQSPQNKYQISWYWTIFFFYQYLRKLEVSVGVTTSIKHWTTVCTITRFWDVQDAAFGLGLNGNYLLVDVPRFSLTVINIGKISEWAIFIFRW